MTEAARPPRTYQIGQASFTAPHLECALYLVATPIGNLRDISLRALEVLAGVDRIACEDTRVTRILLDAYAIRQKLVAYHDHNDTRAGADLIKTLEAGMSVALVSDAGTPLISDPGFDLVRQARLNGIKIVPLPGASALLTALVVAELPLQSFLFDGFLPAKSQARRARLISLQTLEQTLIFYESPHRVAKSLKDMVDILGAQRQACLCRELTKYFETIDVDTLGELAQKYDGEHRIRGEIVLVVGGAPTSIAAPLTQAALDEMLIQATHSLSPARAAKQVATMTGEKRDTLYQRLLILKQTDHEP